MSLSRSPIYSCFIFIHILLSISSHQLNCSYYLVHIDTMCGGTNNKPCGMCRCTNCGSTSVVRVIDGVEIASSAQGSGLSFTKDDMLVDNQTTSTDATASPNPSQQQQEKETSHEAVVAEVEKPAQRDDWLSYSLLVGLIAVTLTTFPNDCIARVSLQKVWYFGWITAVATGLGVLPFYIFGSPNKYYMGIANGASYIYIYIHTYI